MNPKLIPEEVCSYFVSNSHHNSTSTRYFRLRSRVRGVFEGVFLLLPQLRWLCWSDDGGTRWRTSLLPVGSIISNRTANSLASGVPTSVSPAPEFDYASSHAMAAHDPWALVILTWDSVGVVVNPTGTFFVLAIGWTRIYEFKLSSDTGWDANCHIELLAWVWNIAFHFRGYILWLFSLTTCRHSSKTF